MRPTSSLLEDPALRDFADPPPERPKDDSDQHYPGRRGRRGVYQDLGLDSGAGAVGSSHQLCGFYPFPSGTSMPSVGIPLGRHQHTGQTIRWDPFEWVSAGLTTNPGVFIIASTGTGKSALMKRMALGLAATGTKTLVLGDVKPEYGDIVTAMQGKVWRIGHGAGSINPLDDSYARQAIKRLELNNQSDRAEEARIEMRARRAALLAGLVGIGSDRSVNAAEHLALDWALERSDSINQLIYNLDDNNTCSQAVGVPTTIPNGLSIVLRSLLVGKLSGIFADRSTGAVDLDAPAFHIDVSAVNRSNDAQATALAMLAVWKTSFGIVNSQAALAQGGLAPPQNWLALLDELWLAIRASEHIVAAIDSLTRTNRTQRVAQVMATHSLKDLNALPSQAARDMAKGFIERSGLVVVGSVPANEGHALSDVVGLSEREIDQVAGYSSSGSWATRRNMQSGHSKRGKFILKAGTGPGIPLRTELTQRERQLYDTDAR